MNPLVRAATVCITVGVCACISERPDGTTKRREPVEAIDKLRPLPQGSVGFDASRYPLRIDRVREWYHVVSDFYALSDRDTSFHLNLQYSLDAPTQTQIDALTRLREVSSILSKHAMTPHEFVMLTTLLNTGWGAVKLVDSLGASGAPVNVGPELLAFMNAHRYELDAMQDSLDVQMRSSSHHRP